MNKMVDKLLDAVRFMLYGMLIVISFLLFQAWQKEHPQTNQTATTAVATAGATQGNAHLPAGAAQALETSTSTPATSRVVPATPADVKPAIAADTKGQLITVTTDVLKVQIDTDGGDIVKAELLKYPKSLGSKTPYTLLTDNKEHRYIAESGLLSKRGPDTTAAQAKYTTDKTSYELAPGKDKLFVTLHWKKNGVDVEKTFTFKRDQYQVSVAYDVKNNSSTAWTGHVYNQLMRTDTPPKNGGGFVSLTTYFGAAVSSPDKRFEKVTFKDMKNQPLSKQIKDGWVSMIQHYFISAWIPPQDATFNYYSQVNDDNMYAIGMIGPALTVDPGKQATTLSKLYVGPSITDRLETVAPGLNLTIDYGWFWFISMAIFWMMQKIYDVVGNWGWSIVLVTIIIKLLFYKLSAKSYRSMSLLKKLQPKLERLKEQYGDDKQKLTQATMELYKKEKVNPMSGCLPILIQIPVFIGLYWVLVESVQLRQAPFILWIHDLSTHDPYYILPLLMGLSMFIQQRLNPPPPDPTQAKVMMFMPVIFTFMFANFPAGLMLYWFVNNTLSFLQQWYVMRTL